MIRPPPKEIRILLPVWGGRYTDDFLNISLPSLLAPGNIPALAGIAPCTIEILTSARDAEAIRRCKLWPLLQSACSVRFEEIDDLISDSSATVLTLAYAQAIRNSGKSAVDICFIPLVADYVVADGSLLRVAEKIFAGASGVVAGNPQVVRQTVLPALEHWKDEAGVLALPARDLVGMTLGALHYATRSCIVGASRGCDPTINRLFWQVDDHCMIGRFYLMHMIAIRPETTDFVIGAFSDYSLIPELCPSGSVVRITDSDEYFAIECQPRRSKTRSMAIGELEPISVANALLEWSTADHRENADHVVVFHAGRPTPRLAETIARSDAFIAEVNAIIRVPPKPIRPHPVWLRALDHHVVTAQTEQDPVRLAEITGDPSLASATSFSPSSRLRDAVLGRAPDFRRWHPRWIDARKAREILAAVAPGRTIAIAGNPPARVRLWLEEAALSAGARSVVHQPSLETHPSSGLSQSPCNAGLDVCFCLVAEPTQLASERALTFAGTMVKAGGTVVLGLGSIFSDNVNALPLIDVQHRLSAGGVEYSLAGMEAVVRSPMRVLVQERMMRFARKSSNSKWLARYLSLGAAGTLAAASLLCNNSAARNTRSGKRMRYSSIFLSY